ncbi:unnamed protein product [Urochloa decumbens]|uniref:Uncharacterized protein n=1 Tax=Urochloa decumbens TaxID=240449 RepID=A0ABC9C9Z1_9POAL
MSRRGQIPASPLQERQHPLALGDDGLVQPAPYHGREEQPGPRTRHERQRERRRHGPRQRRRPRPPAPPRRAGAPPLRHRARTVQREEGGHLPRPGLQRDVVEHDLVHDPRHEERREQSRGGAEAGAHGAVDAGAEHARDHEVPPPAPEVAEGGGQVGPVELRLELSAQQRSGERRGGGQEELEHQVHVRAVEGRHGPRREPRPVAPGGDERGEERRLGRVGEEESVREGAAGRRLLVVVVVVADLDGERGAGDEAGEREVGVERAVAGGEEEELEGAEPNEEEGGDGAEVDGGEGEGEEREEEEHRKERREAGDPGGQARGGEPRVGQGHGRRGRDRGEGGELGRHACLIAQPGACPSSVDQ